MLQLRYLCFVNTAGYVGEWYCQRDSNPRRPAENGVSLALDDGSICSWLPPHDSNVPVSVNSGAPSPRWLDGNEMWSNGESNSGRRSCKAQLQPAACPDIVPSARFELASCVLQTRAITRFANRTNWSEERESNPHRHVGNVQLCH